LIYNLIKTFLLFFTLHKLRPPSVGIEATVYERPQFTDKQTNVRRPNWIYNL